MRAQSDRVYTSLYMLARSGGGSAVIFAFLETVKKHVKTLTV